MKTILKIIILFFFVHTASTVQAQHKTEIGLTGGAARFYPEADYFPFNFNNSMDNGWGWSAGLFIQDYWKPKIIRIGEINYYNLSSDIFLQKDPTPPWFPEDGTGRQPIYGDYGNTSFNQIAISGGLKYFLNKSLFFYPGIEFDYTFNKDVGINKFVPNLKFAVGVELGRVEVLLEYMYALEEQQRVYDISVPFAINQRNKYLQLKVQIPLLVLINYSMN